jgi:nucleotide-binding universal stress UspA family protein
MAGPVGVDLHQEMRARDMRLIVAATDGSECADRAIDMASTLAKATGAKLVVITVGDSLAGEDVRKLARAEGGVGEALELITGQILQRARERAHQQGVSSIEVELGWGDPAETIIETARRRTADAIVLGRRGRGRLTGLLLGSVSQKLVSLAPCAVVVVP